MRITLSTLQKMRQDGIKIAMLTCYDASFAAVLEEGGVDTMLIGDSLGNVLQGHESTLPVTLRDIVYHTECVARGSKHAFIVGDMPFSTFQISPQETLRNAVKHSQAKHVRVMVQMSGGVVRLTVIDDGCGFDMRSPTFAEGLGFVGMRERLRIVGGELEINSQRAQGTRIEVTIPLGYEPHAMKTTNQ